MYATFFVFKGVFESKPNFLKGSALMPSIEIKNVLGENQEKLYQWDMNRIVSLDISELPYAPYFQYQDALGNTYTTLSNYENGKASAYIPNQLLQTAYNIKLFVYLSDGEVTAQTIAEYNIDMIPRAKPSDYCYEENVSIIDVSTFKQDLDQNTYDISTINKKLKKCVVYNLNKLVDYDGYDIVLSSENLPDNVVCGEGLNKIVRLSQEEYDMLENKSPQTMYVVIDGENLVIKSGEYTSGGVVLSLSQTATTNANMGIENLEVEDNG